MSSIVCIHNLCSGAGSICKCQFPFHNRYGAVRRNIQESGFKTVHPWKSQAPPSSTPIMSWCAINSHLRSSLLVHSSATTTTAALYLPTQYLVPIVLQEMLSMVTPSSPVQTPTIRKNVQTTFSLASRSSNALPLSILVFRTLLAYSDHTTSLDGFQVHSRGLPDGLPGPLPPLALTLGLQSLLSHVLQVDARIPGLVPRRLLLVSSLHGVSSAASTAAYKQAYSVNHILVISNWACLTTK